MRERKPDWKYVAVPESIFCLIFRGGSPPGACCGCSSDSPQDVGAGQPHLECGQWPSVVAVRPAGTGALRLVDTLLPSRRSVLVLLPRSLLWPALVLSQEDVKVFPPARHGSAVHQRVSLCGQQRAGHDEQSASETFQLQTLQLDFWGFLIENSYLIRIH